MKKFLAILLFALAVALLNGAAHAAGPRLLLDHTVNAVTRGATTVTADYILHVENRGDLALSDLTLTLVPRPPLFARNTVNLGHLAAHEKREVFIQVVTPMAIDAPRLARLPMSWAATCQDGSGKIIEFPVLSRPGGDQ